jgi:hypothetical protein
MEPFGVWQHVCAFYFSIILRGWGGVKEFNMGDQELTLKDFIILPVIVLMIRYPYRVYGCDALGWLMC